MASLARREFTLVGLVFGVVIVIAAKLITVYIQHEHDTWEIVVTKIFLWALLIFLIWKQIEYTVVAFRVAKEEKTARRTDRRNRQ